MTKSCSSQSSRSSGDGSDGEGDDTSRRSVLSRQEKLKSEEDHDDQDDSYSATAADISLPTPAVGPTPSSKPMPPQASKDNEIKEDGGSRHQDSDSKIKLEGEESNCHTIPFVQNMDADAVEETMMASSYPMPLLFNSRSGTSGHYNPSRRLTFEDDNDDVNDRSASNPMASLACDEETQDYGSPAPIGAHGTFPDEEEMNIFPPFQNQYHIDDSYSTNLLGAAFLPSPNESSTGPLALPSNTVSSSSAHPLLINIQDIRAQYGGPTLNNHIVNSNEPYHTLPPLMETVRSSSLDQDSNNQYHHRSEENGGKNDNENNPADKKQTTSPRSFGGKTLQNLNQISASHDAAARNGRRSSKRSRAMTRNLPLRKRHTTLGGGGAETGRPTSNGMELMTTPPVTTTRSTSQRLVSRSVSAEKHKVGGGLRGRRLSSSPPEQISKKQPSRNRSRRQSVSVSSSRRMHGTPSSSGKLRTIQHFTPRRNTIPILSSETSLPNTIIIGCKCSKSKCLKLYCDCFQAGYVCSDKCGCKSCLNTIEESGKTGRRTTAIQSILDRRPDAFDVRVKKSGEGCSCKKNRCLKKYCDCFNSDLKCDPSKCRCTDCQNSPFDDDLEGDESSVSVACDKEQSEYDEGEDGMDDIQTPFKQEEDYQADFGFVASSSSISLLDDKAPIFQDDGVAV